MGERLRAHLAQVDRRASLDEATSVLAERIQRAIEVEVQAYGLGEMAQASLGDDPEPSELSKWYWHREGRWTYVLELKEEHVDSIWEEYSDRIRSARLVHNSDTWEDALGRAVAAYERAEENLQPLDRLREIVRFRLRVVEQVLKEYEVLGHVGMIDPSASDQRELEPPDISRFRSDHLLFIVLAHEAVQANPAGNLSRSALLSGKGNEDGGIDARAIEIRNSQPDIRHHVPAWYSDPQGGKGKAKALASGPPTHVFWTSEQVGLAIEEADATLERDDLEQARGEIRRRRERLYFDQQVEELFAEIADAGIRTVDDLALYLRDRDGREINRAR